MSVVGSPALEAIQSVVADGQWHDGLTVLREAQRVIQPGMASRQARVRDPKAFTEEELIAMGRRAVARTTLTGMLERGALQLDVEKLTPAHWSGEQPWQVRNPQAGYRTIVEAADELDIHPNILRTWLRNGYIPYSTSPGGLARLSPGEFEIAQRVRLAYPGKGKIRWPVDPRTLWGDSAADDSGRPVVLCPHCHGKLTVTVAGL